MKCPIQFALFSLSLASYQITYFILQDELSMGMAAGIQLIGWEVGHCFDYPDELLKNHALKKLTAPNDLIKVK